jgi:hypothetical protein
VLAKFPGFIAAADTADLRFAEEKRIVARAGL